MVAPFLEKLSEFVGTRTGIHFSRERLHDLEKGFLDASKELGFNDPYSCFEWLISSPIARREIEILASHLTIGETYFFREKATFELLERELLPQLIDARRREGRKALRIWCAGCATGEEPYSVAILLHRLLPDIHEWNITLLATDINPVVLNKAAEGIFTEWSFRDCPDWLKGAYFTKKSGNTCGILPAIKKLVTFNFHNLAEDPYPSLDTNTNAMDFIFCRNVLIYFSSESAKKVVARFHLSLVENGWLIVGASEASTSLFEPLQSNSFPGIYAYQKKSAAAATAVPAEWQVAPEIESKAWAVIPEPATPMRKSAPKTPPVPAEKLLAEARRDYEEGRYAAAREIIDAVLKKNPLSTPALVLSARLLANQGDLERAHRDCLKAVAADKMNPLPHYLLAHIFEEEGALPEAVKALNRSLYLEPKFIMAHFFMAHIELKRGNEGAAMRSYRNARFLVEKLPREEILPESDGLSAGRLAEILDAQYMKGAAA